MTVREWGAREWGDGGGGGVPELADRAETWELFEDFINGATDITISSSGAGATTSISQNDGAPGVAVHQTGTTNTGRSGASTAAGSITNTGGVQKFRARVRIAAGVPTLAEDYEYRAGFGDLLTGAPTDGAYFEVPTFASGLATWQVVTADGGSRTTVNTGIALTSGLAAWVLLELELASSACIWRITDETSGSVASGSVATDIPDSSDAYGLISGVIKSVGTTNRQVACDFIGARGKRAA